jgi:hypothetical protein
VKLPLFTVGSLHVAAAILSRKVEGGYSSPVTSSWSREAGVLGDKIRQAITPDIQPVSYPKNMPPNAAKAHMRYAFTVTGASIRATSVVPWITTPPAIVKLLWCGNCYKLCQDQI